MGDRPIVKKWKSTHDEVCSDAMPLTNFQKKIAKLLSIHRSEESHLAGGAALHIHPNSIRYSQDLDYFHDSEKAVAEAFQRDEKLLKENHYEVQIDIVQPGYVRVQVKKGDQSTKIEWAHDSQWRFFPVVAHPDSGFQLHDMDLAINKVLALAGRNEARDFLDVIYVHENILSLGALCWAAIGKDPGFTPQSLLELLKRRGQFRDEDFQRLHLVKKIDLHDLKKKWLKIEELTESFILSRPFAEQGCLYLRKKDLTPYTPEPEDKADQDYATHYGKPGGVIPVFK